MAKEAGGDHFGLFLGWALEDYFYTFQFAK
jgi:hypothetical protein